MKYLKKFNILFCGGLFFTISALAKSEQSEQWMRARNISELEKIIEKQSKKEEMKVLCLLQLKKETVPDACYKWKQTAKNQDSVENIWPLPYLNERCGKFSDRLNNLKQIEQMLQNQSLSLFCRKNLKQTKKLIEYRLRDQEPKNILKWRSTE